MIFISICIIINSRTLIDSMLILTIILLIFALTKVKMIVYEFSGGCVTIRKTHPFSSKKFIRPEIEFPQNYIKDYNVRHNIILGSLILKVHSKRKKNYSVKVGLFGFSYNQRKSITSSLQNIFISK